MFVPFLSLREMSLEMTSSGGVFNLRGAVPLPRQTLLDVPQAGGCSWHLPLECQTASFCGRHTEEESEGFKKTNTEVAAFIVDLMIVKTNTSHVKKKILVILVVFALLVVQLKTACVGQSYPDKYRPDLDLHSSFQKA